MDRAHGRERGSRAHVGFIGAGLVGIVFGILYFIARAEYATTSEASQLQLRFWVIVAVSLLSIVVGIILQVVRVRRADRR
jgi:uncharacterized membrane protein YbhN (UPF0104 family)